MKKLMVTTAEPSLIADLRSSLVDSLLAGRTKKASLSADL
jgi:hypothetical protein